MKLNARVSVSVSLVLSLAFVTDCGTGDTMSPDQFCQAYAKRECAKVAAYCSFAADTCEPTRVAACRSMAAAQATGNRRFESGAADKCLSQVDKTYATLPISAASLTALDDACARIFAGTAKATEACTIDYDCENSLICDKGRCGTLRVVGSGGGCANIGEHCPTGEYCSNTSGIATCTKRQAEGALCTDTQPCLEALRCTGTCTARLDNAAVCTSDDECTSGYCNPYVTAGSTRKCGLGLSFSDGSPSCAAYMAVPVGTATDAGM